jgi:hypothetical protein
MKGKLLQHLVGLKKEVDGQTIETTKLSKCNGESRVLIVRGKKRAGFEFSVELHWAGNYDDFPITLQEVAAPTVQ